VDVLSQSAVSIAGARTPTSYGTQMAQRLGRVLAARGCDHRYWLGGLTRSRIRARWRSRDQVLGTGVNVCYLKENKKL